MSHPLTSHSRHAGSTALASTLGHALLGLYVLGFAAAVVALWAAG